MKRRLEIVVCGLVFVLLGFSNRVAAQEIEYGSLKTHNLVEWNLWFGVQGMGYRQQRVRYESVLLGVSSKFSSLEYSISAETWPSALVSSNEWADTELRHGERVEIARWLVKARVRTRPLEKNIGIQMGLNYYYLKGTFKNEFLFRNHPGIDVRRGAPSLGIGIFKYWRVNRSAISLLWLETNVFANSETVQLFMEAKFLTKFGVMFGFRGETIKPKPRFTNFYYSTYVAYLCRL